MRAESGRLKQSWYAAGTSEEIGKPVARTVLGERLVLWRDADGTARAHTDRCLHRNAPLSEGVVVAGKLACPYHGWTYGPDGRVAEVPAQAEGEAPPPLRLPCWPVVERYGLVWVWMGEGPPDREPFPMPYWEAPGWKVYYMVTEFDNGVTQLVENFMDVPHTIFVHKGWFRTEARREVRMEVERTDHSVLVTYHQPNDSIGFTSRILNPSGAPMTHTDRFYMPNTTRVDYHFGDRGFVITSTCTPEAPYRTRVYTLISYNVGSRSVNRFLKPFLRRYTRRVIEQDVDIMRVQGANLKAHGTEFFHHSEADLHHEWIEELREWARAGSGDPPPGETRETRFFI